MLLISTCTDPTLHLHYASACSFCSWTALLLLTILNSDLTSAYTCTCICCPGFAPGLRFFVTVTSSLSLSDNVPAYSPAPGHSHLISQPPVYWSCGCYCCGFFCMIFLRPISCHLLRGSSEQFRYACMWSCSFNWLLWCSCLVLLFPVNCPSSPEENLHSTGRSIYACLPVPLCGRSYRTLVPFCTLVSPVCFAWGPEQ